MIYLTGLAFALSAFWFALSGETSTLFLIFFAVALLVSLWLAARLEIIDRDASSWHRLPQFIVYLLWLGVEMAKANIAVIRLVLSPRGASNPGLVKVDFSGRSDLAKAVFANSITLTPGTVTVDVEEGGKFLVHALEADVATPDSFAAMDRRAARTVDGKG